MIQSDNPSPVWREFQTSGLSLCSFTFCILKLLNYTFICLIIYIHIKFTIKKLFCPLLIDWLKVHLPNFFNVQKYLLFYSYWNFLIPSIILILKIQHWFKIFIAPTYGSNLWIISHMKINKYLKDVLISNYNIEYWWRRHFLSVSFR